MTPISNNGADTPLITVASPFRSKQEAQAAAGGPLVYQQPAFGFEPHLPGTPGYGMTPGQPSTPTSFPTDPKTGKPAPRGGRCPAGWKFTSTIKRLGKGKRVRREFTCEKEGRPKSEIKPAPLPQPEPEPLPDIPEAPLDDVRMIAVPEPEVISYPSVKHITIQRTEEPEEAPSQQMPTMAPEPVTIAPEISIEAPIPTQTVQEKDWTPWLIVGGIALAVLLLGKKK